jgi:hypothetical protein
MDSVVLLLVVFLIVAVFSLWLYAVLMDAVAGRVAWAFVDLFLPVVGVLRGLYLWTLPCIEEHRLQH